MRKMPLFLIAGVFGLFLVFFGGSEANAYSGAVSVKSIGIEEFVRDGYAEAVRNNSSIVVRGVFSLPNCTAVGGMVDGLVGGFDMDGSGNVTMGNKTTDITNEDALTAMLHNTFYLQRLMDCSYGDIYSLVDERGALRPEKENEARDFSLSHAERCAA